MKTAEDIAKFTKVLDKAARSHQKLSSTFIESFTNEAKKLTDAFCKAVEKNFKVKSDFPKLPK